MLTPTCAPIWRTRIRNEEQADSFTYNVPGTKTVITPQSWKERALQVGYPFERRSANGGAQRAQYGVRDTGEYAVSVITSLYKGRKYIDRFLKNIVTQTIFDRSELIIIDANSPEGESEVIEAHMKHYQNIVYLRMAHRIGIYDAWNIGVNMSRGSYLTNANVDDVRARNSLELQAAALDAHAFADVVYQDYYTTFDSSLNFEDAARFGFKSCLPVITPANLLLLNSPHNAPMWRKALHQQVGLFDSSFESAGDWEFWLRCASQGKRFFKINTPHVLYFMNPEGVSTKKDTLGPKERQTINRQYCRKLARPYLPMSRGQFAENLGIRARLELG